jgi:hypothetical protein
MRLTLRTLLAYVDDTLDPVQTREIGLKVAESEVARELIERIRKVTRRRSLGVPEASDPNVVAEYLDNDLAGDKVTELEEEALHSEVHLAEIAACHQLLTIILTEPAQVPPTARQRMYGLVKGPEADPGRPVPRLKPATLAEVNLTDEHDTNVLVSHRGGARRLATAGGLVAATMVAVWMATRDSPPPAPPAPAAPVADATPPERTDDRPKAAAPPTKAAAPVEQPKAPPAMPDAAKAGEPKVAPPAAPPGPPDLARDRRPSDDRRELGKYVGSGLLLQSVHDKAPWTRTPQNGPVFGAARLLAMPGLTNEIRLGDAVAIELMGSVPEFQLGDFFETVATPFVPPPGFDADVRLDTGRLYVRAARPGGAKVRVRLGEDFFDATLPDNQAELIVERVSLPDDVPYEKDPARQKAPVGHGFIAATRGDATVSADLRPPVKLIAGPKPVFLIWDAVNGPADAVTELAEPLPTWAKSPYVKGGERPLAQEQAIAAVKRLPALLSEAGKDLGVAVSELASDRTPFSRRMSLYCQAALDDMSIILDAFDDQLPEVRAAAATSLHHWLGRDREHAAKLAATLVSQKGFSEAEADTALKLFFGFDAAALDNPKTYANVLDALKHPKQLVREVALWRMRTTLDPEGARQITYSATASADNRLRAVAEWKRRIPDGQLPPGRLR